MSVNNVGAGAAYDAAVLAAYEEGANAVAKDLQAAGSGPKKAELSDASPKSSSGAPLAEPVNPLQGAVNAVNKVVDVAKNILTPSAKTEPKVEPEKSPSDGPMAFADSTGGQGESSSSVTKIPAKSSSEVDSRERDPRDTERDARDTTRDARDTTRAPRGSESPSSDQPQAVTQEPAPQTPTTGAIAKPARSDKAIEAQQQAEESPEQQVSSPQQRPANTATTAIVDDEESSESSGFKADARVSVQTSSGSSAQAELSDEDELSFLLRTNPPEASAKIKSKTGDEVKIPGVDGVSLWSSDQAADGVAMKKLGKLIAKLYFEDPDFKQLVDRIVAEKGSLDLTVAKWDNPKADGALSFSNGTEIVIDSGFGVTREAVTSTIIENNSNEGLSDDDTIAKIQVDNASNGR